MTITKEIKEALREVYRPLKRAYELKGTVFSTEFDRAKKLANERLYSLCYNMSDSAFGLWKLGLIPEEQMDSIVKRANKLHRFVVVAVEHLRNAEKEAYGETAYYSREYDYIATQGFSEAEFVYLFGTKENYVKNSIAQESLSH